MVTVNETTIKSGQAVYTPFLLKLYNILVLDISNRWIWRCQKTRQLAQFKKYVTPHHLDIGVGTGYYLAQCEWPSSYKLALMDLNPHCLQMAKSRLKINVNTYLSDIFKPQPLLSGQFSSISLNYLLHCLPGSMEEKAIAIANAVAMLRPGGVLFGATILSDAPLHTFLSHSLCDFYNKKKIFSNQQDTRASLQFALNAHLVNVEIAIVGSVAMFKGVRAA